MNSPTETEVKDACDVLSRDYWCDVRGLAKEIERQIRDGEITSSDDVYDAIHNAANDHQRVIYTWQANLTVCFCDGDAFQEYEDEFGERPKTVEVAAWFALNRDVTKQVVNGDVFKAFDAGEPLPPESKD